MLQNKVRSFLHVIVQFTALAYLIFSVRDITNALILGIIVLGILLGLWSVWVMRKSRLSVFPEPGIGTNLIVKGPYKYIRHPMYTSLFLVTIPLLFSDFSILKLLVFILFSINQILKLYYEEKLLLERIPEYKSYMITTWRLVPILF